MNIPELVARVEAVGGILRLYGDDIAYRLPAKESPRLLAELRAHREEAVRFLRQRRQVPQAIPEGWVVLAPRLSGGSKPQSAIPNCSCCHKPWKVNRPRKWEGKTYAWLEPGCRCLDAPKMRCCGQCWGHCECRWAQ
jgi:hypothetical protein